MRMPVIALLAIVCTLGACTDDHANVPTLRVTPSSVTLAAGTTATLTASGGDSLANVTWTSSAGAIATVTGNGPSVTITGEAPGQTTITAQLGDQRSDVEVTVTGATVDRIEVTAARTVLAQGNTEQLTAHAIKTDNTREDITQTATWTTRDTGIVSVDDRGQITVRAVGTTTISATRGGVTGSLQITGTPGELRALTVTPQTPTLGKGQALPLVANGTFSDGAVVDLTANATWTTSAPAIATVSTAGIVQSLTLGSTTITATLNGFTASTLVTVGPPVAISLAIEPNSLLLTLNTDQQLRLISTASDGATADVTARATWSVTGSAVTISPTGLLHAAQDGTATITARADGLTVTARADVRTPLRLDISPRIDSPVAFTFAQQQRLQLRALLIFPGTFEDVTATATWSSSAPAIASVVAGRIDTQTQSGVATLTATAAGFSVPITVDVTTETCHPVINEVLARGDSPSDEWIELFNPCTHAVNVAGWTRVYHGAAANDSDFVLVTLAGSMAPSTFRLYAGAGYTGTGAAAADDVWPGSGGVLRNPSFGVGLLQPTASGPTVVNGVAFGTVVNNPFLEGRPGPGVDISSVSCARFPFEGKDTHDNRRDFSTFIPSPRTSF